MKDKQYKFSFKSDLRNTADISVNNVGFQQCAGGYRWGPGIRDHFLLHHVVSGKGKYSVFGKTYSISEGNTFFSFPGDEITYCADSDNPWEYYWVGFQGGDARLLLEYTDFTRTNPVIKTDFNTKLRDLLLDIYNSCGNSIHETLRMTGKLYLVLSLLIEKSLALSKTGQPSREYAMQAESYIINNISRPISVDEISGSLRLSRSQLYRIFMKHFNCSPIQYLTRYRIKQACLMLKQPVRHTIATVAYSVGYENPLYFSKIFKKQIGITPSEYAEKV